MAKIGIFYGSSTGNTEEVAEKLQSLLKPETADLHNVDSADEKDIAKYECLILGTPTWGIGDMQDDMEDFLEILKKADLKDKRVALFGLGDQDTYPESFADGIGTLYENLKDKTKIVGEWPTKNYSFADSDAVVGNNFVGLIIDQDNQAEMTDERLQKWVEKLKSDFCL
jgi:flavodoxin I